MTEFKNLGSERPYVPSHCVMLHDTDTWLQGKAQSTRPADREKNHVEGPFSVRVRLLNADQSHGLFPSPKIPHSWCSELLDLPHGVTGAREVHSRLPASEL